jgi:NitT/TauT family transport system substrate-binding protein
VGEPGADSALTDPGREPTLMAPARRRHKDEGERRMTPGLIRSIAAVGLAAPLAIACAPASAEERFKVVIGNMINWENQGLQLGQDVGIYKKHGVVLEIVGAQGAGETIQAVISGSAEIGGPIGIAGAYRAFSRGAPIRIISPMSTGENAYWYVRGDSPIKTLKDATESHTISYSTSGSTTDLVVTGFVQELGLKAKPTKTGGMAATFPQVMSGQVDIGWGSLPFGLEELRDGRIRMVARGDDLPSMRTQTVRVLVANANVLKTRKDAVLRLVKAYRETVDWMYADPKALQMYAKKIGKPEEAVREVILKDQPRPAMQYEHVADVEGSMRDAIKLQFLDKPLTKAQLDELIQIPPRTH